MIYKHIALRLCIGLIADRHNVSFSRLAILSGLDATALNKSKWFSPYGKRRWLSCGTLFQIMISSETHFIEFAKLFEHIESELRRIAAEKGEEAIYKISVQDVKKYLESKNKKPQR